MYCLEPPHPVALIGSPACSTANLRHCAAAPIYLRRRRIRRPQLHQISPDFIRLLPSPLLRLSPSPYLLLRHIPCSSFIVLPSPRSPASTMSESSPVRVLLNSDSSSRSSPCKPSTVAPPQSPSTTTPSAAAPSTAPPSPAVPSTAAPSAATPSAPSAAARCEGCHSPHDASYGSGRFCSVHCARRVAASRKWHKQRLRARLKTIPSPKPSRSSSSHCLPHARPFLLPARAVAPVRYYNAPHMSYHPRYGAQFVTVPYPELQPSVPMQLSAQTYHQQPHFHHQSVLPCATCVSSYQPYAACAQPAFVTHPSAPIPMRAHAQPTIGTAPSAPPPHLFHYPSSNNVRANPKTNSSRGKESRAVAEALLCLKSSNPL